MIVGFVGVERIVGFMGVEFVVVHVVVGANIGSLQLCLLSLDSSRLARGVACLR